MAVERLGLLRSGTLGHLSSPFGVCLKFRTGHGSCSCDTESDLEIIYISASNSTSIRDGGVAGVDDLPDFLTIEEAARVLRIGRGQAYELARLWRASGGAVGLPNVEIGVKTKRVPKTAILAFLQPSPKAS